MIITKKKAAIAVSISWVLMIIIGVFLIGISYKIVTKYQANEELKMNSNFNSKIQNIFSKIGRTSGIEQESMHELENVFSGKKIESVCNNNQNLLSIDGRITSSNNFLNNYPTYINSIDFKKTDSAYLVVENLKMPFKITNLLAITTKRTLIIFDKNSNIGEELYDKFKTGSYSTLNYIFDKLENSEDLDRIVSDYIENKNLNDIVIVTDYDKDFNNFDFTKINEELKIIKVEKKITNNEKIKNTKKPTYGNISFYNKNQQKELEKYFYDYDESNSIITMAIFSNSENFNCNYNKIIEKTYETYTFYNQKAEKLKDESTHKFCSENINMITQKNLYSTLETKTKDFLEIINSENIDDIKYNLFSKKLEDIIIINYNLGKINCPYLY